MYERFPYHFQCQDLNDALWRYIDFTKLVSMLDAKSLYFACVAKLEDKFEGAYSNIMQRFNFGSEDVNVQMDRQLREQYKATRNMVFVNCWHLSNHESAAMWRLYLKSDEGVAIRSTVRRLKGSIESAPQTIHVGEVKYLDYDKDSFPTGLVYAPCMCKRKSYQYEQEVRALYFDESLLKVGATLRDGESVPVDLDVLVEAVYVAPTAPQWFHALVESMLRHYGLKKEVKQSDLATGPVW